MDVSFRPTRCAICGNTGNTAEKYAANFDPTDFSPAVFSARRLPDRIHYRMVTCATCGLVRSDPVAETSILTELYRQSTFDYSEEVINLRRTYGRYLSRLDHHKRRGRALLEVGCGNGFFLEEAVARGYGPVTGIEPSFAAVSQADASIKPRIVCDVMRPNLFDAESFDVVCLFQVFDHLADPSGVLEEIWRVMRPGGLLLVLNHNIEAVSARLLAEQSPIIDIEHTYLFSPRTLSRLATAHGFDPCETGVVWNDYSPGYLVRLLPIPASWKLKADALLRSGLLRRASFSVPLGNLYLIARKGALRRGETAEAATLAAAQ